MFSCRRLGETGREEFNLLSPARGDLPVPNFFFFWPIWRTGCPPKPATFASWMLDLLNFRQFGGISPLIYAHIITPNMGQIWG
jgi:hypothetical protein